MSISESIEVIDVANLTAFDMIRFNRPVRRMLMGGMFQQVENAEDLVKMVELFTLPAFERDHHGRIRWIASDSCPLAMMMDEVSDHRVSNGGVWSEAKNILQSTAGDEAKAHNPNLELAIDDFVRAADMSFLDLMSTTGVWRMLRLMKLRLQILWATGVL